MGKHTKYSPPSKQHMEISMEDVLRRNKRIPFWKREAPLWAAALLVAILIVFIIGGMWIEHTYLKNYPDNPKAGLSL